jgi:(1->4)-alpha-D-glucan 1-alpha-D-glucosylmutase
VRAAAAELLREGEYMALPLSGSRAEHILAFARHHGDNWAVIAVPLKVAALLDCDESVENFHSADPRRALSQADLWADTAVEIPDALSGKTLHNVFTGRKHSLASNRLEAGSLFQQLPVCVLVLKETTDGNN